MLDSVKQKIEDLPDKSFNQFYQEYIFKIQDDNLEREVSTVKSNGVISLTKLVNELHKQFKL